MIARARIALALAVSIIAAGGCASSLVLPRNASPLAPFKPSLETSALEIVFVRHPYELAALNEDLWSEVDETAFPADARRALEQNGLRAGLVRGTLPMALETALAGKPPAVAGDDAAQTPTETSGALEIEPVVTRRTLHALPGRRSELLASPMYDRLPLLIRDGKEVHGETYARGRCVFALKATPLGDGRVRLSLLPEVQHGDPRQQYRGGDDGVWRLDSARPTIALDKMAIDAVVSPGQAILLGTRTNLPGSVGHYFFTEPAGGQLEQKLLLIRFDGTKYDSLLMSDAPGMEVSDR